MLRELNVVTVDDFPLEQVTKQLNKLINVIKIVEQDEDNSVARELMLVKVRADATVRAQVIEVVNLFRAKVVDVSPESVTIEATGTQSKLDALLRMLDRTVFGRSCNPALSRSRAARGLSPPPSST